MHSLDFVEHSLIDQEITSEIKSVFNEKQKIFFLSATLVMSAFVILSNLFQKNILKYFSRNTYHIVRESA